MRRICIMSFYGLLLIPVLTTLLAGAENSLRSWASFLADSGVSVYQLADRFILIGTDSVFVDSLLLSRESYALDAARGSLTFPGAAHEAGACDSEL